MADYPRPSNTTENAFSSASLPHFPPHTSHSNNKQPARLVHAFLPRKRPRVKSTRSAPSLFPLERLPREVITIILEHVVGTCFRRGFSESNNVEHMRLALNHLLPLAASSHSMCAFVLAFFKRNVPFELMYRFIPPSSECALHLSHNFNLYLFAAARKAATVIHRNNHTLSHPSPSLANYLYNSLPVFSERHTTDCRIVASCALLLRSSDVLDMHFLSDFCRPSIRCVLNTFMFMNLRFKKLVLSSCRHLPFATHGDTWFKAFLRSVKSSLTHLEMPLSLHHQRATFPLHVFPIMPVLRYIHFKIQHMDEFDAADGHRFQLLPNHLPQQIERALPSLRVVAVENMFRTPSQSYQSVQLPPSVTHLRIVRDESVINAFRDCAQLQTITFHRAQINSLKLVLLMSKQNFPNLKRVALIACDLSLNGAFDQQSQYVPMKIHTLMSDNACSCTPLKSIDLMFMHNYCPNLEVLDFWLAKPYETSSWETLGRLVEKLHRLRVLVVEAGQAEFQNNLHDDCAYFCQYLKRSCSTVQHLGLIDSWLGMEAFHELIRVKGAELRSFRANLYSKDGLLNACGMLNTKDAVRALCAIRKHCPRLESLCLANEEQMNSRMSQIKSVKSLGVSRLEFIAAEEVWERTAKKYCYTKFRQRLVKEYSGIDAEVE
eukprot:TRINITY_DN9252_c0_g1_i1.p1 TRINITY_DN9252_c0_g1~~TRINITY_DN9252_c0_g1_i1.p1  ORF type:complete len:660 (-),score=52.19 TRINITY_DN9252_c0_g1_i1:1145-3124(-)